MKHRGKKRTLILVMTLALLAGTLPPAAFAAGEGPSAAVFGCTQTEGCTLADGHEGECVTEQAPAHDALAKAVTGWTFVDDENLTEGELAMSGVDMVDQADLDTVVDLLPAQISAEIEGGESPVTLDLAWSCPEYTQDGEGRWPLTGDYTFTAALADGYACDPLPTVKVLLGGADTYAANNTLTVGGLTVKASNNGEVTYTQDSGFTLKASGTYEISGTWKDNVNRDQTAITVPSGVTAKVTLNTAAIDVSNKAQACAFAVAAGGTANITLSGTNALTSGHSRAGLEVPKGASVTIAGDGSLTATGGSSAAGIGGSNGLGNKYDPNAGSIAISGGVVVTAQGGANGAGIGGGGIGGGGGTITISGGKVSATGGSRGAGIGGGSSGEGGTIEISGDAEVTARGGERGAGIGGGDMGDGVTITISGGKVSATGGDSGFGGGAGIGGGRVYDGKGNGGTIEISGGKVSATGGGRGAGIGGGGNNLGGPGGSGGHITIRGGIVEAVGNGSGAGIGGGGADNQANGGEAGTIEINGDTVVFATAPGNGAHIGSGGNYREEGTNSGSFTEGVVFEGEQGTVHGSPTLPPGDVTIPNGSTLTVLDGATLTIPDGTTLTNNGTMENNGTISGGGPITNNGTVNDHSGGINVAVNGTNAVNKPSEVEITFLNSQGQITQAAYGDAIQITATAQQKAANTLARGAALNKVDFYVGSIAPEHHIGTAEVATDSGTATATLEITLSGAIWSKGFSPGVNTIIADFGGADVLNLLGSTGTANLTVKASPSLSLEADPAGSQTLPGNVTLTATLSGASPDNTGKTIAFTVNGSQHGTAVTDGSGVAAYLITNPSQGSYTFDASFAGDILNTQATAAQISGYAVGLSTQAALGITGLDSAYTYGCEAFDLSTSGGSGSGAVSYGSSDPSVATVTGSTVTIQKAGTFTITATKAGDSHYAEATVTSHAVTVHSATPNMSLAASGGSTTSDPLILTATVSKVGTGAAPAGTVTFKVGDQTLHSVPLDGDGKAVYTISSPAAGSHTYTAEYSGQAGYYNDTSAARTIGVGLSDQTGFTITDPGAKTYGDGAFTLTASGGQGTGSVSFSVRDGNGVLAVAADGSAKIVGAGRVTVTATKDADSTYNQATATLEIAVKPRDISNVTVKVTGSHVYTGSQLQPGFEVYDGNNAITTGDYTNSYGTNVAVGTGAGSITLTGQRNYTGTKTVQFDIEKRSLSGAVVTLEASSYPHTGSEIKPAVTKVTVDGITVPAAEYDVGYADNKEVGTATVTITAKADGNFSGSASAQFTITKANTPSGGGFSSPSFTEQAISKIKNAKDGDTVKLDLPGNGSIPGKVLEAAAGKDITLEISAGKGVTWILNGKDIPKGELSDLDLKVNAKANTIPVTVINALTGEKTVMQLELSHNGPFGFPLTLRLDAGKDNAGLFANLYYYDEAAKELEYQTMAEIGPDGSADLPFTHASSYAVIIDKESHAPVTEPEWENPFTDVGENDWFYDAVRYVHQQGLMVGTTDTAFSPGGAVTRAQVWTVLARLDGRAISGGDPWYAPAQAWAVANGVSDGTNPDGAVTREQLVTMLYRYAQSTGMDVSVGGDTNILSYDDAFDVSEWAIPAFQWACGSGIVSGTGETALSPQAGADRAQLAAILMRFLEST